MRAAGGRRAAAPLPGADLRRWGALKTGAPAFVGALLGVPVWLLLRLVLGSWPASFGTTTLVPTATGPGWWALLLVVAVVSAYGALVGVRAATRATKGVARPRRRPRPCGLLLVVPALVPLAPGFPRFSWLASDAVGLVMVAAAVVGFMATTPWLAYVVGGLATRRTSDAALLLSARRIRADHGAAGRAAAAVGMVGLTLGFVGAHLGFQVAWESPHDRAFYVAPTALVGVLAVLVAGLVALSLSLHSIETVLARRREMAALVAAGVPVATLAAAVRAEGRLVTLPVTVVTALVASVVWPRGPAWHWEVLAGGLLAVPLAAGSVLLGVHVAARLTRPWLIAAVAVGNLRTE